MTPRLQSVTDGTAALPFSHLQGDIEELAILFSMQAATLADVLPPSPPKAAPRRYSWAALKTRALSVAIGGSSYDAADWSLDALPASFFDLEARDAAGVPTPLSGFRGHVCLVTNVASN